MRFEGIHHVTCITADAPGNVDFYVRVLGLRLVKKSVNQDDPTVYHLFYADEKGSAGSDLTFFEYPHARRGHAGAGMVHRIVFRVASDEALDFWEERLAAENVPTQRVDTGLRFENAEGLGPHWLPADPHAITSSCQTSANDLSRAVCRCQGTCAPRKADKDRNSLLCA